LGRRDKPPKLAAKIPETRGICNHRFGAYIWNCSFSTMFFPSTSISKSGSALGFVGNPSFFISSEFGGGHDIEGLAWKPWAGT
jgi:hypothetical protein